MSTSVRRAALAAVLPLLLVAGLARAAETIRFAVPAGLSFRFEQTSTMELDVDVEAGGQRMDDRQRIVQTLRGTATVLASEDGLPTRARLAFDRASGTTTTMMGREMPQPFALAGRTVELALDGTRLVSIEPAAGEPPLPTLDPATERTIADVVAADLDLLPDGPVAVGDTWTARPRREGDQVHPTLTYRVVRFADRDGRRVAELACEGVLVSAVAGMELDGRVAGPSVVDLATGLTLEGRLAGDLATASETDQGGMRMRMTGRGTIEQASRVTIGAEVAAGGADGPRGGTADAADARLDGAWAGDGLEMRVDGDRVSLALGEQAFEGGIDDRGDGRFAGRFTHRGTAFAFAGTWAGDEATFTSGGRTYRLRRPAANPPGGPEAAPPNPLGGEDGGVAEAGGPDREPAAPVDAEPDADAEPDVGGLAPEVARATAEWSVHEHETGASFRHPADWRVQAMPTGLLIAPPDLRAAEESILALGSPAEGEPDPLGPRVVQAMDELVARTMPGLRRSAAPRTVPAAGGARGARFEYVGRAPDGRPLRCVILMRILNDTALGFAVLGLEDRVAERLPTVSTMFATLRMTAAANRAPGAGEEHPSGGGDPRLVGAFRGEAIRAPGPDGVFVNTQLLWAFNADGTVLHGARSAMSASRRDVDGNLVWTMDGETGANVERGRWTAAGGILTIRWDDGSVARLRYGFEPDGSLVHRNVRTGELINFYPRVR